MAAWTGGLGFSLLVGALLDLVGAAALIVLIGGERQVERYAAA